MNWGNARWSMLTRMETCCCSLCRLSCCKVPQSVISFSDVRRCLLMQSSLCSRACKMKQILGCITCWFAKPVTQTATKRGRLCTATWPASPLIYAIVIPGQLPDASAAVQRCESPCWLAASGCLSPQPAAFSLVCECCRHLRPLS